MKLTSTSRLRIVTIAITTLLTSGIGVAAALSTYSNARSDIDSSINSVIQAAQENPDQELSASLFYLEQYSLDLSLILISRDGERTTINESTQNSFDDISLKEAEASTRSVLHGTESEHFRFKALEISGGDYLVVSSSTEEADAALKSNLFLVAGLTLGANFIAFLLLTFYIGRLKKRDDVEALTRMQEFLGDASHELRTPLTVVKGYVELLSKGQITDSESQIRAFARVNGEIARMESLIHDLLLLAELGESGGRESEEIDLSSLVKAHCEDFLLLNSSRKVTVAIEEDIHILAVEDYLSRFIQNALGNIRRHTPDTAEVLVKLSSVGKKAVISIEDAGPGLPESAYAEKVRTLHRFDKSRARDHGGSGLGMSIMQAVIRKLGGEFNLHKSELGGVAVVAQLPRLTS